MSVRPMETAPAKGSGFADKFSHKLYAMGHLITAAPSHRYR